MRAATQMLWDLGQGTFCDWWNDKAPRLGAALAFYAVFSLAPLVLIALALVTVFLPGAGRKDLLLQIRTLAGPQVAGGIAALLPAEDQPHQGTFAAVAGLAALLFGASGLFGQLQDALNTIWHVQPRADRGFREIILDRFLSVAMVLGTGFLLLVSLIFSALLSAAGKWMSARLAAPEQMLVLVSSAFSFAMTALLFALIFKLIPEVRIAWRDVWIAALLTAFLFTIGRSLFGLYLSRTTVTSAYGAAGSFVVILLWVYYSSQILFFGAEFAKNYARIFSAKVIEPVRSNDTPQTE
ncbi:MAG: YihY/virulence factor BrkB family protein [Planctomycetaceae bacterium]